MDLEELTIKPPLPNDISGNSTMSEEETIDFLYKSRHQIKHHDELQKKNYYLVLLNEMDFPTILFSRYDGYIKNKMVFTTIAHNSAEEHIYLSFNNWIPVPKHNQGQIEISDADLSEDKYNIFETHPAIKHRMPYLLLSEGLKYPEKETFPNVRERYLMNPEIIKEVSMLIPSRVNIKTKKRSKSPSKSPERNSQTKKRSRSPSKSPERKRNKTSGGKKHSKTNKTKKHH